MPGRPAKRLHPERQSAGLVLLDTGEAARDIACLIPSLQQHSGATDFHVVAARGEGHRLLTWLKERRLPA